MSNLRLHLTSISTEIRENDVRKIRQQALRYILAALAAVAALILRKLLDPLLGSQNPYHTVWLAVVCCAWYCGIAPSIVAVAISVVGVWYWFLPPYRSFVGKPSTELFGMLGFMAFSAVIVALGESGRRIMVQRQEAEERLRKVQGKLVDRVKQRTEALEQKNDELIQKAALLDLANDAIFVRAANRTISYWNRGAERLYGWTVNEAIGRTPAELLRSEYPIPLSEIESMDNWEGEIHHTKRNGSRILVASRWTMLRDAKGNPASWLEINTDITARKQAEDAAKRLSGRILALQDAERRRLARGLHDSLGQYLAALKINLDQLAAAHGSQVSLASECSQIVEKCVRETRTISYLLHPPLLDEAGFGSAARWYVDGFAQRSGITANLNLPSDLGRLDNELETALFRVVQEGLTNVHKHADSSTVDINLNLDEKQIRLEIKDYGRGIPQQQLAHLLNGGAETGVGIAGLQERFRELGGFMKIESDRTGTRIIVTAPLVQKQAA